jgi:TonB-dependent receptor
MTRVRVLAVVCLISLGLSLHNLAAAQTGRSGIIGHVNDSAGAAVQHARVELQPGGIVATTGDTGDFTISDLAPGDYTLTISYVGFSVFSSRVRVGAGEPVRVNAVLQLGTQNESITVHSDRQGGEAEALDIERTADNIVQVLPADVITSLPNTNIADALGRLPSVSLERDEGEGKYVQIRGTEPRLSNVTLDGIHLPSPEGVRNVKLDAIPADLVESVEINKTLSANQDADAIGGSVNLVTRTATDQPYISLMGMGGYTPITGGRELHQFAGTAGQRFGSDKRFGALFGFSYDYNARGVDDLEPAYPTPPPLAPNTEDLRNYHYDRSRYGFDGELDYRLGNMSSVYLRGLFSHFNDNGEDWRYSPGINNFITGPGDLNNVCGITTFTGVQGCGGMVFTNVYRKPTQQIVSVQAGARHVMGKMLVNYELALSEANYTGGFSFASFNGPGSSDNSVAFGVDTKNPFLPKFNVLNGVNIYDPATYALNRFADTEKDGIFERDVVGDISLSRQYSLGGHFSTFEVGFKGWDARKTSVADRENFKINGQPMTQFLGSYRDNNYYFHQYTYGPTTEFTKIIAALQPGGTTPDIGNNLPNDWDISERIWAAYLMNTINFGNFRVQAGVRIESTSDALLGYSLNTATNQFPPVSKHHSYTNAFPSVQAQYRLGSDTILRAAYGMGIARPNFKDAAPYQSYDPTVPNFQVTAGNPNLLPTHAHNFDLLAEHYLGSTGLIQGGVFYKYLTDPIFFVTTRVPPGYPQAGSQELAPVNGPSAHIVGFEAAWQQRLTFLPGALNGVGVSANYGHTTSRASFPSGGRSDHPTLARTAPNNWNFDMTYDKKRVSARMGLTHNSAYLWSYGGSNAKDPTGDTYLYPHTQVDAQVSYWIPRGHGLQAIVSALNLNNEVFGFYNGAERYPIQREYYSRTFSAGLRWTLGGEPQ